MELPSELANEIYERLEVAREHFPGAVSADGTALLVDGGIGYGCYLSPDGDMYLETYDPIDEQPPVIDRSRRAQITVMVLGARTTPGLGQLLPERPLGAPDCGKCMGIGRLLPDTFHVLCPDCCGLGWVESQGC